jgi:cystathionine beta-lyase/cystathionine gamma-synthase
VKVSIQLVGGELNTTSVQNPGCGSFKSVYLILGGSEENLCLKARVRPRKLLGPAERVLISLPVGEDIVAADDIYGGTDRLLSRVVPRSGVTVK